MRKISISDMSDRLGISYRTYTEYLRGKNEPKAMKAVLNLLSQLEDNEIIAVVKTWKEGTHGK